MKRLLLLLFTAGILSASPSMTTMEVIQKLESDNQSLLAIITQQSADLDSQKAALASTESARVEAQTQADALKASEDAHVVKLNAANRELFEARAFKAQMRSKWGLGAIFFGLKELFWYIIGTLAVVSGLLWGLNFLLPGIGVLFKAALTGILKAPAAIKAALTTKKATV